MPYDEEILIQYLVSWGPTSSLTKEIYWLPGVRGCWRLSTWLLRPKWHRAAGCPARGWWRGRGVQPSGARPRASPPFRAPRFLPAAGLQVCSREAREGRASRGEAPSPGGRCGGARAWSARCPPGSAGCPPARPPARPPPPFPRSPPHEPLALSSSGDGTAKSHLLGAGPCWGHPRGAGCPGVPGPVPASPQGGRGVAAPAEVTGGQGLPAATAPRPSSEPAGCLSFCSIPRASGSVRSRWAVGSFPRAPVTPAGRRRAALRALRGSRLRVQSAPGHPGPCPRQPGPLHVPARGPRSPPATGGRAHAGNRARPAAQHPEDAWVRGPTRGVASGARSRAGGFAAANRRGPSSDTLRAVPGLPRPPRAQLAPRSLEAPLPGACIVGRCWPDLRAEACGRDPPGSGSRQTKPPGLLVPGPGRCVRSSRLGNGRPASTRSLARSPPGVSDRGPAGLWERGLRLRREPGGPARTPPSSKLLP